jgi:hypothetical protein
MVVAVSIFASTPGVQPLDLDGVLGGDRPSLELHRRRQLVTARNLIIT